MFEKTEVLEKKYRKDLYNFNYKEIMQVIKLFPLTQTSVIQTRFKIVKYLEYCNYLNLTDKNVLKDVKISDIINDLDDDYEGMYIFNKKTFEKFCNQISKLENGNIYVAMMMCVWYGISCQNTDYETRVKKNINYILSQKIKEVLNNKKVNTMSIYRSGLIYYVVNKSRQLGKDIKTDLENDIKDNNNLYKKFILEFGCNISWQSFKYNFKDFIIKNY